jgi:type III secretion system YscQ/HrcQ family protein
MSSPAGADSQHGSEAEDPSRSDFAVDAPIELQVEVARFSLTLAELQRLRPGDVLATGRRIGEHVKLRIAGQAFAEGELVDIEGELGVRILTFNAPGTGSHDR